MNQKDRIIELVRQEVLSLEEALELLEASGEESLAQDIEGESQEDVSAYSREYQAAKEEAQAEETLEEKRLGQLRQDRKDLQGQIDKKQEALLIVEQRLRELEVFAELDDLTQDMQDQKEELQGHVAKLEEEIKTLSSQLAEVQLDLDELQPEASETQEGAAFEERLDSWAENFEDFVEDAAHGAAQTGRKYSQKFSRGLKHFIRQIQSGEKISVDFPWIKTGQVVQQLDFDVHELQALEVDLLNGDIKVSAHDGDKVQAHFDVAIYGQVSKMISWEAIQEHLTVEVQGPSLVITSKYPRYAVDLSLMVPRDFHWEDLQVRSMNGDLVVQDQKAQDVILRSTNGDGQITHSQVQTANLHLVNGDLLIKESQVQEVTYDGVNGDFRWVGAVNDLSAKTVNGDFFLTKETVTASDLEVSNVAGDVMVAIPSSVNLEVDYRGNTGEVHSRLSDLDQTEVSKGKGEKISRQVSDSSETVTLDVTTVTGDLLLKDSE